MKNMNYGKLLKLEFGSVVMILLGIILLLDPDFGSAAVSAIAGWVLVGGGGIGLLIGFLSWPALGVGELILSFGLIAAGLWLLKNPLALASALGMILGLVLLSQGIGALRDALRVKKYGGSWRFPLILAAAMGLLGLYLILSPLSTSRFLMTVVGICMIACGVANLFSHRRARKYIPGPDDDIIDAE